MSLGVKGGFFSRFHENLYITICVCIYFVYMYTYMYKFICIYIHRCFRAAEKLILT